MYLERLNRNDPFSMTQQLGMQSLQDGMQAKNAIAAQEANAMQNAMADYQRRQQGVNNGLGSLLNLGLSMATGGIGTGVAGNALTRELGNSALGQMARTMAQTGLRQVPGLGIFFR